LHSSAIIKNSVETANIPREPRFTGILLITRTDIDAAMCFLPWTAGWTSGMRAEPVSMSQAWLLTTERERESKRKRRSARGPW